MPNDDLFSFDFDDLDFDLEDFDISGFDGDDGEPDNATRILKPRIDLSILTRKCIFRHAEEFAKQIDLSGKTRTFAWISGSFIFGDLPEALWRARRVDIKRMHIATLSLSEENIDSWAGLLKYGDIEEMNLLCSAYFRSHEMFDLIPIVYQRLDIDNKFQIAYGPYHVKLIAIETHHGNTILIHGSANTRSSRSVEQIMVEVNNRELFDFNANLIRDICRKYGTINRRAKPMTYKEVDQYFDRLIKAKKRGGKA